MLFECDWYRAETVGIVFERCAWTRRGSSGVKPLVGRMSSARYRRVNHFSLGFYSAPHPRGEDAGGNSFQIRQPPSWAHLYCHIETIFTGLIDTYVRPRVTDTRRESYLNSGRIHTFTTAALVIEKPQRHALRVQHLHRLCNIIWRDRWANTRAQRVNRAYLFPRRWLYKQASRENISI